MHVVEGGVVERLPPASCGVGQKQSEEEVLGSSSSSLLSEPSSSLPIHKAKKEDGGTSRFYVVDDVREK